MAIALMLCGCNSRCGQTVHMMLRRLSSMVLAATAAVVLVMVTVMVLRLLLLLMMVMVSIQCAFTVSVV